MFLIFHSVPCLGGFIRYSTSCSCWSLRHLASVTYFMLLSVIRTASNCLFSRANHAVVFVGSSRDMLTIWLAKVPWLLPSTSEMHLKPMTEMPIALSQSSLSLYITLDNVGVTRLRCSVVRERIVAADLYMSLMRYCCFSSIFDA